MSQPSRGLRVIPIDDLEISFPFEPYQIQLDLMAKVIQCIKTKSNGLLESPTGTGKTLSILCASLSWQIKEKHSYKSMLTNAAQLSLQSSNAVKAAFEPPKIIYASRTHSQLSQAVLELKRSHYRHVKAVVLGSRDLLCIHEEVQRIPNSAAKIMACHAKIQRHMCTYHNNVQRKKDEALVKEGTVIDIEDIVQKGKQGRFCPFFMSRELVKEADIVFMPYNYLLDPKIRSHHGIDLNNSVIIFDEGHNIPKLCEEAVSFEIRSSLIAMCILELTKALNEFKGQAEGESVGVGVGQMKELTLHGIIRLKQIFLSLEEELDKIEAKSTGYLMGGEGFLEILSRAGFSTQMIPRLTAELDLVGTFLTGCNVEASGCDKFGGILRILSSTSQSRTFGESYKIYVELEMKKDGRRDFRLPSDKSAKVFNLWCFNPSIGLEALTRFCPRSIILASGTLSPISFLQEELKIPFPVELSNPHVICDNQLFAGVFKYGPRKVLLSSTYENRDNREYVEDLGEAVLKICSVVPGGVLIFFASYAALDSCVKAWREKGILTSFEQYKKVLVETRGSESFKQVLQDYYAAVRGGGGCLMAVCRGKVSEGLDFTDDYGRAVILTGIPYAPAMDPKIVAKKQYLDDKVRLGTKHLTNGRKWYQLEACRALNQAIGRIIRHAHDYGAIIFCDARCEDYNIQQNLPGWVSGRLHSFNTFSEGLCDLAKFFGSSIQKERQEAQTKLVEKQKKSSMDFEKFTSVKNLTYDTTDEELLNLYAPSVPKRGISKVPDVGGAPNSEKRKSGNGRTEPRSLFADLNANPMQKMPDFNYVVPDYSPEPLISWKQVKSRRLEDGSAVKKIKVVSSLGTFSNYESRERLMREKPKEGLTSDDVTNFLSTSEFWQWVKLTLGKDNYSNYIRAIKKFKDNQNTCELAEEVGSYFKVQFIAQCLQGMSLFLTSKQLDEVKEKLTIPL